MVTGDALYTAVHVAAEVKILDSTKRGTLTLEMSDDGGNDLFWADYTSEIKLEDFSAERIQLLRKRFESSIHRHLLTLF